MRIPSWNSLLLPTIRTKLFEIPFNIERLIPNPRRRSVWECSVSNQIDRDAAAAATERGRPTGDEREKAKCAEPGVHPWTQLISSGGGVATRRVHSAAVRFRPADAHAAEIQPSGVRSQRSSCPSGPPSVALISWRSPAVKAMPTL